MDVALASEAECRGFDPRLDASSYHSMWITQLIGLGCDLAVVNCVNKCHVLCSPNRLDKELLLLIMLFFQC